MSSCEKCWKDSGGSADKYQALIKERVLTPCTPEEQAGENAEFCKHCNRVTIHQYVKRCVICGIKK